MLEENVEENKQAGDRVEKFRVLALPVSGRKLVER